MPKFPEQLKERINKLGVTCREVSTTAGLGINTVSQAIRKDQVSKATLASVESAVKKLESKRPDEKTVDPIENTKVMGFFGDPSNPSGGVVLVEDQAAKLPEGFFDGLDGLGTAWPTKLHAPIKPSPVKPATVWELAEAMEAAASRLLAADPHGHVFEAVLKRVQPEPRNGHVFEAVLKRVQPEPRK